MLQLGDSGRDVTLVTERLYARGHLTETLLDECVERGSEEKELPIVIVYGPRGSGKSSVLDTIAANSATAASLPHLRFDCSAYPTMEAWQIAAYVGRVVTGGRWEQFRPVWFPRATLGGLVLAANITATNPKDIEDAIYLAIGGHYLPDSLTANLPSFVDQVREALVPSLSGLSRITFLQPLLTWAMSTRKVTNAITHTGMSWYSRRMSMNEGGLALTDLV